MLKTLRAIVGSFFVLAGIIFIILAMLTAWIPPVSVVLAGLGIFSICFGLWLGTDPSDWGMPA
jgi:hypothetical protein